jgi:phosphate transport system substrate-binding protein
MFIEFNAGDSDLTVNKLSKIRTVNSRTHGAYMALINQDTDIILVSTLPSEDEAEAAREAGIELEVTPIGLDAFVFIVNEANPIDNLKTEDVVGIYTGDIKQWEEVGEWDASIEPYVRNRNSGSQELMNRFIMKDKEMGDFPEPTSQFKSMAPLIDGVSTNQYSIGYTLFYYRLNMIDRRERMNNVKVLALDGVAPSEDTISTEEYPHVFNIYAVVRKDLDTNSSEYKIKQWLTSEHGQSLIREAGYVRLY